jgi:small subunit ribosomal protein S16
MLKIRLARAGTKKRPFYHIVVTDSRNARDGKFIEKIGTHDPLLASDDPKRAVIDAERLKYWQGVGAQTSDRMNLLLARMGLGEKPAIRNRPQKSAPKAKAQERQREREEKAKAAAEAASAASEAAAGA